MEAKTTGVYTETITAELATRFARAIGAPEDGTVPPTFLTRFRRGEFELLKDLGVPLSRVLHGEQEYEIEADIRAGETVSYVSSLTKDFEKRGGASKLRFLVFETRVTGEGARAIATSRTTIIVRDKGPEKP